MYRGGDSSHPDSINEGMREGFSAEETCAAPPTSAGSGHTGEGRMICPALRIQLKHRGNNQSHNQTLPPYTPSRKHNRNVDAV